MMISNNNKKNQESNRIFIKNIVVFSDCNLNDKQLPLGEYDLSEQSLSNNSPIHRLYDHIKWLVEYCEKIHLSHKKETEPLDITRLMTNEFYFYTKKPLHLIDFQKLMDDIFKLAKKTHEDVHLILSSFAVLTVDNYLMNVTCYLQCGKNAKIDLILKKTASYLDPNYQKQYPIVTKGTYQLFFSGDIFLYTAQDSVANCINAIPNEYKNRPMFIAHKKKDLCLWHGQSLYLENRRN